MKVLHEMAQKAQTAIIVVTHDEKISSPCSSASISYAMACCTKNKAKEKRFKWGAYAKTLVIALFLGKPGKNLFINRNFTR